jgi:DNA-binding transcriptional MerR regulator
MVLPDGECLVQDCRQANPIGAFLCDRRHCKKLLNFAVGGSFILSMEGHLRMESTLTIRALAVETGVSSKTLRYWESRGLLPKPQRTHTGYRVYPVNVAERVRFIQKGKSIGFTLSEILSLFALVQEKKAPCEAVDAWAGRKLKELDQQIALLTELRVRLQRHRRRWRSRPSCPPMKANEICCLIEELPLGLQNVKGGEANDGIQTRRSL